MNKQKLITALLLMLPGLSWGGETPTVSTPEPGMLALLGAGGVVAGVVWVIRRKK
jgi:hypothetical protein